MRNAPCTRQAFLAEVAAQLRSRYAWAHNQKELDDWMAEAERALRGQPARWDSTSPAVVAAWYTLTGFAHAPRLSTLRNLPAGREAA